MQNIENVFYRYLTQWGRQYNEKEIYYNINYSECLGLTVIHYGSMAEVNLIIYGYLYNYFMIRSSYDGPGRYNCLWLSYGF